MVRKISIGVCIALLSALVWIAGCNKSPSPSENAQDSVQKSPEGKSYLLPAEPSGAKGVIEVRKGAKDGDAVVVVGRVGGSKEPLVKGRTAFTIVDPSLKVCSETEGDTCSTPWDYCCTPPAELTKASAMIKIIDAQGKTLAHEVQDYLGIQPLQTVVVQGHAKRDADGNLTVLAEGVFVRP